VPDSGNFVEKNNIRKQYLLGKYTGIPEEPKFDFCSLLNTLNDNAETAHESSPHLLHYSSHHSSYVQI